MCLYLYSHPYFTDMNTDNNHFARLSSLTRYGYRIFWTDTDISESQILASTGSSKQAILECISQHVMEHNNYCARLD